MGHTENVVAPEGPHEEKQVGNGETIFKALLWVPGSRLSDGRERFEGGDEGVLSVPGRTPMLA